MADVRQFLAPSSSSDPADEHARARAVLERALNYRQCVRELHETLGVPDEIIAHVAGVHPGTVKRWRSMEDVGEPRQAQERAIEEVRTIALVLIESETFLDLKGIGVWLRGRCRNFNWTPVYEVLAQQGGYERVLTEAARFVGPGAGLVVAGLDAELLAAGFGPPRPELTPQVIPEVTVTMG